MKYRNGWLKLTKESKWEHFIVQNDQYFRNGMLCEPFDFDELRRTAYEADGGIVADD